MSPVAGVIAVNTCDIVTTNFTVSTRVPNCQFTASAWCGERAEVYLVAAGETAPFSMVLVIVATVTPL